MPREKEKAMNQGLFRANVKNVHAVETPKCGMSADVGHTTDICPVHTIVNDMQVEPQDCNWVAKTQGNAGWRNYSNPPFVNTYRQQVTALSYPNPSTFNQPMPPQQLYQQPTGFYPRNQYPMPFQNQFQNQQPSYQNFPSNPYQTQPSSPHPLHPQDNFGAAVVADMQPAMAAFQQKMQ